jgi:Cu/Ag efflux protein CusF
VKTLALMALLFTLATAANAAAQAVGSEASPTDRMESRKATTRNINGIVKSSSPDTVVVTGHEKGKDMEWTFAVEVTTDIRKGGKSIVPGDLKRGDAVQVRFTEQEGKATARSILVKGNAAAKKSKS